MAPFRLARAVRLLRIAIASAALGWIAGPGIVHADACVFASKGGVPPRLCVAPDGELDLHQLAQQRGLVEFPVRRIQLDDDALVAVSSGARFTGRIRYLSQSTDNAGLARRGLPFGNVGSLKLLPTACVFEEDAFQGKRMCFAPGQLIDRLPPGLDHAISSIRIPSSLSMRVLTAPATRTLPVTLRRSRTAVELAALRAHDAIRALQVTRTSLACTTDCTIPAGDAFDLAAVFGGYWNADDEDIPQLAFTFDVDADTRAVIEYGPDLFISMVGTGASALPNLSSPRKIATLEPTAAARYLTVALSFHVDQAVDIQLTQHDAQHQLLHATAPATVPWPAYLADTVSIRNATTARVARLANILFGVAHRSSRHARGVRCNDIPIFAVVNTLFHLCEPAPLPLPAAPAVAAAHQDFLALAGAPLPSGRKTRVSGRLRADVDVMQLERTIADGRNPFAVHAAARVCGVPLESLVGVRRRRQTMEQSPPSAARPPPPTPPQTRCMPRVADIVTLYQQLFPARWDLASFGRIVDQALGSGTTGVAGVNAGLEARFVAAVRSQTGPNDTRRADALRAFRHADVLQRFSLARTMDLATHAARAVPAAELLNTCGADADAAALRRRGVLGLYRLNLRDYVPRIVMPLLRHGDGWRISHEPFTVQHLHATQTEALRDIAELMRNWARQYLTLPANQAELDNARALSPCARNAYGNRDFLADAGASIATGLAEMIEENRKDAEYVVVSFRGKPVAVLLGTVPAQHSLVAEVDLVVSAPPNVLAPLHEGAIRRAGSFALHTFLGYAAGRGMQVVLADAVSLPSALAKQNAGFRLVDDFDDEDMVYEDRSDSSSGERDGGGSRAGS